MSKKPKKDSTKGLVRLRKVQTRTPEHYCENCKCRRYSPCTCSIKADK